MKIGSLVIMENYSTGVICSAETISKLFTVPRSKRVITPFFVENELYNIT